MSRGKRRRLQRAAAKAKAAGSAEPQKAGEGARRGGERPAAAPGSRPRVPEKEWKALHAKAAKRARICKWFNLSCGCVNDQCKFDHVCWECGATDHAWVDRHFRG